MEATYYLDLPPKDKQGEINSSFKERLEDIIGESFPVKKDFEKISEQATLIIYYPKGRAKVSLFRCLVVDSCTAGNNMIISYKRGGEIAHHTYNRYYLHERETDIVNGDYYEFLLVDNALMIRKITEADREIEQNTIDTDSEDLLKIELAEKERKTQPGS